MIKLEGVVMISDLHRQRLSVSAIARECGLDRKTVRRTIERGLDPPAIRKMIYTTNAVESLNRTLRKVIKTRGSFPSDEAALKLLYLAIQHAGLRWKPAIAWPEAKLQFLILFEDCIVRSAS